MMRPVRLLLEILILVLVSAPSTSMARSSATTTGYTVSVTDEGVQLTLHFARRDFPRRALIAVTDTIRNRSHPHLALTRMPYPYGFCQWPVVSLVSVNAEGKEVEPAPPIPLPIPSCAAQIPRVLPVGQSYTERQFIVLWSPHVQVTAQFGNIVHNSISGFQLREPAVPFRLHPARPATVAVIGSGGSALVLPPAGPHGPLYVQSWGRLLASHDRS